MSIISHTGVSEAVKRLRIRSRFFMLVPFSDIPLAKVLLIKHLVFSYGTSAGPLHSLLSAFNHRIDRVLHQDPANRGNDKLQNQIQNGAVLCRVASVHLRLVKQSAHLISPE